MRWEKEQSDEWTIVKRKKGKSPSNHSVIPVSSVFNRFRVLNSSSFRPAGVLLNNVSSKEPEKAARRIADGDHRSDSHDSSSMAPKSLSNDLVSRQKTDKPDPTSKHNYFKKNILSTPFWAMRKSPWISPRELSHNQFRGSRNQFAENLGAKSPINSVIPTVSHPLSSPDSTVNPPLSPATNSSSPMANLQPHPLWFIPPGQHLHPAGPNHRRRVDTVNFIPTPMRHEDFVLAIVHPALPEDLWDEHRAEISGFFEQVSHVRVAASFPHPNVVALFQIDSLDQRDALVLGLPINYDGNHEVRFVRHD